MSAIVEQGAARCPRCMAPADYSFHEGDDGQLSYRVSCDSCSHEYVEICTSWFADASAA